MHDFLRKWGGGGGGGVGGGTPSQTYLSVSLQVSAVGLKI